MNSEILFALIRKNAFLEENYPISSDTKLIEDLEYDSVKLLGLIVAIENEFELSDNRMIEWE